MRGADGREARPGGRGRPWKAWFLVGPTGVGKTAVAHDIARALQREVLSADSMLVYRGMDIGTAKPDQRQRGEVRYRGIDLADPWTPFSVGDYMREARAAFEAASQDLIVVGGTGLYVKCLVQGLDDLPAADPATRAWAERLQAEKGIDALQDVLRAADPQAYDELKDNRNPRRLIRALELARSGARGNRAWQAGPRPMLVGLRMDSTSLQRRLERRVREMYQAGLLEEVRGLLSAEKGLSETARHAIGYKEAIDVLAGGCTIPEAVSRTVVRTRHLAKRQMTWFRHQAIVNWIDVKDDADPAATAARVREAWEAHGPTPVNI